MFASEVSLGCSQQIHSSDVCPLHFAVRAVHEDTLVPCCPLGRIEDISQRRVRQMYIPKHDVRQHVKSLGDFRSRWCDCMSPGLFHSEYQSSMLSISRLYSRLLRLASGGDLVHLKGHISTRTMGSILNNNRLKVDSVAIIGAGPSGLTAAK